MAGGYGSIAFMEREVLSHLLFPNTRGNQVVMTKEKEAQDCGILRNGSTRVRCRERSQGHLMETLVDLKGNSHFVVGFNNGVSDKG